MSEEATKKQQAPGRGHGAQNPGTTFKRIMSLVFHYYPGLVTIQTLCIVAAAIIASVPSIFMQQAIAVVEDTFQTGDWATAQPQILRIVLTLIGCYVAALACNIGWTQLGAVICQGTMMKVRNEMFSHMEDLPIRYFDTNKHGDIMSHYTNDVDTLRQFIGQSLPNLLTTIIAMISVVYIMFWYSVPLTLVVLVMVAIMMALTRVLGGRSAHFFLAQQRALAAEEGFAEESMNGQKVIKVFTHEKLTETDFDKVNEQLFQASKNANIYGNTLGPILMNTGNLAYVIVALAGCIFLVAGIPNPSISGMILGIDIIVPFLNLTKRFAGSIGQVSHQINFVVMGLAGAERILSLTSAATREVKSFGQGTSGTLSVGIISSSGGLMPTPSMQRLCRNYPQLRLELHEGNTYEVLDMLKRGEVDVGVVRTPFALDGLNVTYASEERMLALIPKGIRCGKSPDTISLEELSGQPLVIYRRFEHLFEDLFNERQLTFFPAVVADDARTACVWSTRGMGIGLVPETFLATMKHGGTTNKIVECPELVTRMAAVWRKGSYLPPLAERFIKMFENDCAEEAKAAEAMKALEAQEDTPQRQPEA